MLTSRTSNQRWGLMLPTVALVVCWEGGLRPGDVQVQVQDSTGVRFVAYLGMPDVEAPFAVGEEQVNRHGGALGDYGFQRANVGRLIPDGGVVVAGRANDKVGVLSLDGAAHRIIAGPGQGQGEVTEVWSLFGPGSGQRTCA